MKHVDEAVEKADQELAAAKVAYVRAKSRMDEAERRFEAAIKDWKRKFLASEKRSA